jgi:hypothetical protein
MTQGFPSFPGALTPTAFPGVPQDQGLPQFPAAAPAEPTRSVDDFLSGGGKSINFGKPGEFKRLNQPFGGKVVSAKVGVVTNFTTKQPERWPDGRAKEQLIVVLDTAAGPYPEREDANDDGQRTLYVKGSMVNPFRQAIQAGNGGPGAIKPGGLLVGMHTGVNGQAYTWQFKWDPSGQVSAPAPQAPAQPVAAPQPATVPDDQAAAFAAWQAQQNQAAPAAPVPAQQGAAFNPFAQ